MNAKHAAPTLRTQIKRAATAANVRVNDYDRAVILGQLAELLAAHPKVAGKIAFKGGAIMTLVDGSPRLSKDLDSSLIAYAGRRISRTVVMEALTGSARARRIVKRVDRFASAGKDGIRVPVIVCHPLSGVDEVAVMLTIKWSEPLLLDPVRETVAILDRKFELLVLHRAERAAEKMRAFLDRGEHRDAFDLYYLSSYRLDASDWSQLGTLIGQKLAVDPDISATDDVLAIFDEHVERLGATWGAASALTVMRKPVPDWDTVGPSIQRFRKHLPVRP